MLRLYRHRRTPYSQLRQLAPHSLKQKVVRLHDDDLALLLQGAAALIAGDAGDLLLVGWRARQIGY